jgi:hypothetical protein
MLKRITALGGLGSAGGDQASSESLAANASDTGVLLGPLQTLDGFGLLKPPPPTAQAIPIAKFANTIASLDHPPGYYGLAGSPRAINVVRPGATLAPLPPFPPAATRLAFESAASTPLRPWLLAAALALLFADIVAVLAMQLGGLRLRQRAAGAAALVVAVAGLVAFPELTWAQTPEPAAEPQSGAAGPDDVAQQATSKVTLGYVLTGDKSIDNVSRLGLSGLGRVLAQRTSIEPGEPIGVDITTDEIAFYPVLYWAVPETATALPASAVAKIDAFMKQGGMIIFDTRDYGQGGMQGLNLGVGRGGSALQRLLSALDLPRLEPVPDDHVLTRSFYLLRRFPGRWEGGDLWVEASEGSAEDGGRKARRADGVSSILITSNDFAAAWAIDESGRPIYPTIGGENQREMARRSGVNIVMHALTGNYKADQVHVPALLERLGQ